jgi:hypothetical protein
MKSFMKYNYIKLRQKDNFFDLPIKNLLLFLFGRIYIYLKDFK